MPVQGKFHILFPCFLYHLFCNSCLINCLSDFLIHLIYIQNYRIMVCLWVEWEFKVCLPCLVEYGYSTRNKSSGCFWLFLFCCCFLFFFYKKSKILFLHRFCYSFLQAWLNDASIAARRNKVPFEGDSNPWGKKNIAMNRMASIEEKRVLEHPWKQYNFITAVQVYSLAGRACPGSRRLWKQEGSCSGGLFTAEGSFCLLTQKPFLWITTASEAVSLLLINLVSTDVLLSWAQLHSGTHGHWPLGWKLPPPDKYRPRWQSVLDLLYCPKLNIHLG